MPPFLFFFFFFFFGVESWAAAHGLYRCTEYRLLSQPMSTRLLNLISSRICRQNTQFNMYTTTSKQQEGCTFKDSHPKCFITTNFDKFHREAFARGGVTVIWVPFWFMYPHTHITRDMSIPRGDIHSTGSEMIRSGRKSYIQYLYF